MAPERYPNEDLYKPGYEGMRYLVEAAQMVMDEMMDEQRELKKRKQSPRNETSFKTTTTSITNQQQAGSTHSGAISKKVVSMIKKHDEYNITNYETGESSKSSKNLGKRRRRTLDSDDEYEYDINGDIKKASRKISVAARRPIYVRPPSQIPPPVRNLPQEFKDRILAIGGRLDNNLVCVIEKNLYKTDVSAGHSRLSVPYSQIENRQFLEGFEVEKLNKPNGEIEATLVEPSSFLVEEEEEEVDEEEECQKISLRNWKTNKHYVLVKTWNNVCRRNRLTEGMTIQLWSFRIKDNSGLGFALVPVNVRRSIFP